ncbi:hypothetical protein AAMO2058_001638900 [Amorphochlora amoebiformis]
MASQCLVVLFLAAWVSHRGKGPVSNRARGIRSRCFSEKLIFRSRGVGMKAAMRKAGNTKTSRRRFRREIHGRDNTVQSPLNISSDSLREPERVLKGDPLKAEILSQALWLQYKHGFPHTPTGFSAVTQGFHPYPAGLQPKSANILLDLLPGDTLYDPFMGGGTTLVEGMRKGYECFGTDISPLAVFVSSYHTWYTNKTERENLQNVAEKVLANALQHPYPNGLNTLRDSIRNTTAPRRYLGALWFILSATLSRKPRSGWKEKEETLVERFQRSCEEYITRLSSLAEAAIDSGKSAEVLRSDARHPSVFPSPDYQFDAILTSPPYPAVYDYLSVAREMRAKIGGGALMSEDNDARSGDGIRAVWPLEWREGELGARKTYRKTASEEGYEAQWITDQEAWMLASVKKRLKVGGRCVVIIGDSDARWIDTLISTTEAAQVVGLSVEASASIHLNPDEKNPRRTEHAILLYHQSKEVPKADDEDVLAIRNAQKDRRNKRMEFDKRRRSLGFKSWISS